MNTVTLLMLVLVGAYIGWLQLQLYIYKRIVRAFQASAVVVPVPAGRSVGGWLWLGLLLLAGAAVVALGR